MLYLKRGIIIRLVLSTEDAITKTNIGVAAQTAPVGFDDRFVLSLPQARIYLTKPDEAHLAMLRNKLLNDGVVHLPIHVFEVS